MTGHLVNRAVPVALAPLLVLALAGCLAGAESPTTVPSARPHGAGAALFSGLDLASLDRGVRPQDDLYRFAAGTWLRTTPIPEDRSSYGAFTVLQDRILRDVRAIAEAAATAPGRPPGSDDQRIGDFYVSFMDIARIDTLGIAPLVPEIERIDAISSREALLAHVGRLQGIGVRVPIDLYVDIDPERPDRHVAALSQAGIALPDRAYYLEESPRYAGYRRGYVAYVEKILTGAGIGTPADAERIVALETRLAAAQRPREEHRDPRATSNRLTVGALDVLTPGVDWRPLLAAAGVDATELIVGQPAYLEGLGAAVREVPLEEWRRYLKYHLVHAHAPYLASAFAEARFEMFGRTLRGIREDRPRWERAIVALDGSLGDLVGRAYVGRHFSPVAKARTGTLAAAIVAAIGQGIDELEWMAPTTKAEAQAKLRQLDIKVGYPDRWRDYAGLRIARDDLVGNLLRAAAWAHARDVARLGRPVDRGEWAITPQTVNAYYAAARNEIVVPAAILQPPFFDARAEDAVNYGAIGAVIGHEVSHGFDDQGRHFDADGRLRDWWTAADDAEYRRRTERLVRQFDAFVPLPGHPVNGTLTLGENIADLVGLRAAHRAYHRALDGRPAPVVDGFSGDQRLFIAWARMWARNYREDDLIRRLATEPHPPGEFRANGPVSNIDAFYAAFVVRPGDRLYRPPAARVRP